MLRAALVALATAAVALAWLPVPAWAGGAAAGPQVHHVLPENGAVLRTAPDRFEVMFDVELRPGRVAVGIAPDATGRLVALAPPVLDGPLLVQPLPPLPAGRYTVGVQLLDTAGRLSRGTFGFTVDPGAARPDAPGPGRPTWLVPLVGVALAVPAAGWVRRRARRPAPGVTPPPPGRAPAPSGPGRAAGRTPTSASSPAGRPGR